MSRLVGWWSVVDLVYPATRDGRVIAEDRENAREPRWRASGRAIVRSVAMVRR